MVLNGLPHFTPEGIEKDTPEGIKKDRVRTQWLNQPPLLGPGFSSACNTPHRRHKTWVHEGAISTPLIAHWPGGVFAKGKLRHTPAHVIDIVPTVLEFAGIQKPKDWKGEAVPTAPGKSLAAAFSKDEIIARDSLWWLHEGHRSSPSARIR